MTPGTLDALQVFADSVGVELPSLLLAWARVAPAVLLIPAFGLRDAPAPLRVVLGLAFATVVLPAVRSLPSGVSLPVALGQELLRGLPPALVAASALWAMGMAGSLVDNLRGPHATAPRALVGPDDTPVGTLFSLAAVILFLTMGGPGLLLSALAFGEPGPSTWVVAAAAVSGGIALAVGIAAPILVTSVLFEVTAALVGRAASPADVHVLVAPARNVVLLAAVAVTFDAVLTLATGGVSAY